ncbi:Galactonate dehydratase [Purpureocillium takamizusanense]|uniref:Galactonate dehydratase n=1 Tax=Purpureocillium takamizusanense TaxID=2060973 RepID=A0A9Q8VC20_9HYPO|nr:Galactonate dehydratase [Purpureocillium takamizusanense]UNI19536.1 Galactonate dehydratase [Purpureocillium takamizusanense]
MSWRKSFYRGGPVLMSALAGIDIALWDLKARKLNVPIYQLLGGKLRSKLKVYAWIGGDRPNDVEAQASARKAQGFTAVKMNATGDVGWLDSPSALSSCVARVSAVRSLGLDAAVDFHGRLHRPMAKQLAARLAPLQPLFIEEPLLSEHVEGIRSLSQASFSGSGGVGAGAGGNGGGAYGPVPIALGERLHSRWDLKPFLEPACCIDVLQPDVCHVGGISELRRMATMAEAYDVALAPHCPLGPLALAACMQVDAAAANFAIQEMSLGIHYNTAAAAAAGGGEGGYDLLDYLAEGSRDVWRVEDGYVRLMDGPGLGIEIDEGKVREASRGAAAWVSPGFFGPGGELREW